MVLENDFETENENNYAAALKWLALYSNAPITLQISVYRELNLKLTYAMSGQKIENAFGRS